MQVYAPVEGKIKETEGFYLQLQESLVRGLRFSW
jgi:hypothetical protein